ncbi:Bug family tripartite tricarboxylate transporter substrate binding protein [Hydrogenophaga sp. BPS33]|uniref:Bug family tripartite tricarboxylate transporter substrate binding protein n=1 Tax=Hydrogenophaga sp. BPS33 TaxID=2651974 RepID=UPI00131F9A40|nr:tripartite tricarboxylate transporter substrate-binding protein [Hydrogenophaga sp. BPS33]QHE87792.1 tripartite tricarboxylate transporter substrate binding protein [Hydrogenophaga sp. BPS33]
MNPTTRRQFALATTALALAATTFCASAVAADAWPNRPLRMVVGYPAGSSPDVQARLLAEPLSQALGQPVVVENRPGASSNIGADMIAKATDGHTIGVIGNGPLTSSKFLYAKLPYDPSTDFAPIALIGAAPLVWVTAKSPTERTPAAYIAQLRADGDKQTYGSVGPGSGGHLGMELLKQALGINPLHVPFNGGPAILNGIVGGHIQMTLLPASTVSPLVQAGKLDAIAVTSAKRTPLAPTLPSMEDIGVKGLNIEVWNAVVAPATMPAAHQARLSAELGKILLSRDMQQKLLVQGWRVDDPSAKSLKARIASDTALYRDIIVRNKIRID